MSPAVKPGGSCHLREVAWPESPGLRQYVCQPPRMLNSRATQKDWPGAIALTSLTKRAFTLSVAATFPDRAKAAGVANNKPNSQNLTMRIGLCYRIRKGKTLRVRGLWKNSQYEQAIPLRGRLSYSTVPQRYRPCKKTT